ncbi:MAG: hypothetical protein GYB41_11705 [Oceanospirillales bacterium]|uniref:Protoglobin n=1 Tax=Marinobacterium halophilum TaxID=267374 RepID=A0A2P8ELC6_9GAMM|nr:protoglobin domain-containing protein [Marinobacterium halophilum]MBR9829293.1 hypothetical protein [Oceanospirillales bacterium]PSL10274.1 protoglobin [Marinobacterium halophilum]
MTSTIDFSVLCEQAKAYAGFEPEDAAILAQEADRLRPYLITITDSFYTELQTIPEALAFLEGRIDTLKKTHAAWLGKVFEGPYDADFAAYMHKVGVIHVQVKLPEKFMTSGIGLINKHLIPLLPQIYRDQPEMVGPLLKALNAATSFCLLIMLESYRGHELERFMEVTGISRVLYNNLAAAYRNSQGRAA